MSSEFKCFKRLEWHTALPERYRPLDSPVFVLNGSEYSFRITCDKSFGILYYYLNMRSNNKHSKGIYKASMLVEFKNEKIFSLKEVELRTSEDGYFWSMEVQKLQSQSPFLCSTSNLIKFQFNVEEKNEHLLKAKKEMDGKYVQTPSYIDNRFLVEEISHDFSKLFKENSHQDVTFACGDQAIKAHKSVLCCRSEVFASMLQSDMVEGKTGQVAIQDMDATIFKQFLKCLYTGSLPKLTYDTALRFYEAGDKYNVAALRKQCAEFLIDNLSHENACDTLIFADQHNDSDFKKSVLEYFIQEKIPYMDDMWADFCNDNSKLATEVLNLFCQHLRPKPT